MAKRWKKNVDLKDELEEVVSKTTDIAVSLVSSDDILQCTLSDKALEILLIATVGLEGLLNLRHAISFFDNYGRFCPFGRVPFGMVSFIICINCCSQFSKEMLMSLLLV